MKILGLCGSLRSGAYNKILLECAKKIAAELGHELLPDGDLNIPLYNGDIEVSTFPAAAQKLADLATAADLFLIATPEYNHSYSGVIKNAIDWLSRGTRPLRGKTAALFGASDGKVGTVRAQRDLKPVLQDVGLFLLAKPEVYVREAQNAFDEKGNLKDQKTTEQLRKLIADTLELAKKLKGV